MFYLIWMCLLLYLEFYYSYPETTTSPVSATFYNKLEEFLSSYYISGKKKALSREQPGGEISWEFTGSDTKGAD